MTVPIAGGTSWSVFFTAAKREAHVVDGGSHGSTGPGRKAGTGGC